MVKDHTLHLKGCGFLSIPRLGNMPRKQKSGNMPHFKRGDRFVVVADCLIIIINDYY
jgi:hypothetical protein